MVGIKNGHALQKRASGELFLGMNSESLEQHGQYKSKEKYSDSILLSK